MNQTNSTLFTVKDNHPVHLTIKEIFDAEQYDTFEGVTYSASANFINQYLTPFQTIHLITGAGEAGMNDQVYQTLSAASKNLQQLMMRNVHHESANLYQGLTDYSKQMLVEHHFELKVPTKAVIHSKFYLLSNSKTKATRLILGSANLSQQAFNDQIQQFETILIFDDHELYDVYRDYFTQTLYPTTMAYFTKSYLKAAEQKLKQKPATAPVENVIEYTIVTPDQMKELEAKEFKEHLDDLQNDRDPSLALIPRRHWRK